jgi:hypothetical protein
MQYSGADPDISVKGGGNKKKFDFKTICFKKYQKKQRHNIQVLVIFELSYTGPCHY